MEMINQVVMRKTRIPILAKKQKLNKKQNEVFNSTGFNSDNKFVEQCEIMIMIRQSYVLCMRSREIRIIEF